MAGAKGGSARGSVGEERPGGRVQLAGTQVVEARGVEQLSLEAEGDRRGAQMVDDETLPKGS